MPLLGNIGWRRRLALAGAVGLVFAAVTLIVAVAMEPLPEGLVSGGPTPSLRVLDRGGRLLGEVTREGERVAAVRLADLPPHVTAAVLAAEDARFFTHPGIDPFSMLRAAGQAVWHRQLVSGASTITQQLARALFERPRTLRGKLKEIVVALRIEHELDKATILEAYLNHIEFGPRLVGLEAASRALFDKPAARLDLAEAALLVGLPRGPSLYDPTRGTERARRRRDRILERMRGHAAAADDVVDRALHQPIELHKTYKTGRAQHLSRALAQGALVPGLAPGVLREARTTLDGGLQAEVEALARVTVERLVAQDVTAAAVLVVDNATREVLAYVGSQDFWSAASLGQNDGVRALRQPGSALKPFVYAAALTHQRWTTATILPDVEIHLPTTHGDYAPRNYDGKFHGPVRLRSALANSLNIPAVYAAQRTGPDRVLATLHRLGFDSLQESAAEYGAAIALGDGEVTLAELAAAYATLANAGEYRGLVYLTEARRKDGSAFVLAEPPERRALARDVARLIGSVLADDEERQASFGRGSALELPFPVAVKTGTSKGYRDNWAVGFSSELTVAVWVGNFDGHPMKQSSGVTGAGPLFHGVMLAAMRGRPALEVASTSGLIEREICSLSGELPGPACVHRTREVFAPGSAPEHECSMHELVGVLPDTGLRAGPGCNAAVEKPFEIYGEPYVDWAKKATRPLAPTAFDPRCPGMIERRSGPPRVVYPFDGARFTRDPALSIAQQELVLRAAGSDGSPLWFVLDGRRFDLRGGIHELRWPLAVGRHTLRAESAAGVGPTVVFTVD